MPTKSKRPVLWCKSNQCSGDVTVLKSSQCFLSFEHAIPDSDCFLFWCSYLFAFIQQGWPPPQPSSPKRHPNPRTEALPSSNHRKVSFTLVFLCVYFSASSSGCHPLVSSGYLLCHTAVMWNSSVLLAGFYEDWKGSAAAPVWLNSMIVLHAHLSLDKHFPKQILRTGDELKGLPT